MTWMHSLSGRLALRGCFLRLRHSTPTHHMSTSRFYVLLEYPEFQVNI
jgi:hypothetical protein